ncbi:DNA starvation/stationary phase protection protein Dps, partial [Acinetobacter nosocomialis]
MFFTLVTTISVIGTARIAEHIAGAILNLVNYWDITSR